MTWRQRAWDLAAFMVVWIAGALICDAWLQLSGKWMFFGGAISGALASTVGRAAREAAAE